MENDKSMENDIKGMEGKRSKNRDRVLNMIL